MAKKHRKVYRKTKAELKDERERRRKWPEYKRLRRAAIIANRNKKKALSKPKPVLEADTIRIREHELRPMIREAARAGLVEAIEHTSNFWAVSDGYRKYIDQQIALQAEALMAAVKTALRQDRELRENARLRRKART